MWNGTSTMANSFFRYFDHAKDFFFVLPYIRNLCVPISQQNALNASEFKCHEIFNLEACLFDKICTVLHCMTYDIFVKSRDLDQVHEVKFQPIMELCVNDKYFF